MTCSELSFSRHAVERMFNRGISVQDVRETVESGTMVEEYPDDAPYPSVLLLGFVAQRPLHVLVAQGEHGGPCIIVTAYVPDETNWMDDYRTRRSSE